MDEENINKAKEGKNDIDASFKILKKEIDEPSKEEKKEYGNKNLMIKKNKADIDKIEKEIKMLTNIKNERSINVERLIALKQLLESQLEDFLSAKQFQHFLNGFTVTCECGRQVKIIKDNIQDNDYKDLVVKIKDIERQLKSNEKELNKINNKIIEQTKSLEQTKTLLESNQIALDKLSKKIEDFDLYLKLIKVFNSKIDKRHVNEQIRSEEDLLDKKFQESISEICERTGERLKRWGFEQYSNVEFDNEKFDFKYNGTLRYLLSKGFKNICTCAAIIEILLKSISLKINSLKTLVIDTMWSQLYEENANEKIDLIVKDLEELNIQVIIMENKIPSVHSEKTIIYNLSSMKN